MATPAWNAPKNGDTTNNNDLLQFLGTHAETICLEGTNNAGAGEVGAFLLVNTSGTTYAVNNTVSLANRVNATQFKTAAGQTAIERVVIPLKQVGNGADVTISLYSDAAGQPGTQVGSSVTIPASWCVSKSSSQFPTYVSAYTGVEVDTQSQLPAALFRFGGAWNGSAVCVFGGGNSNNQTGAALQGVYIGKPTGTNGALQWQTTASLPVAVEWHGYCCVPASGSNPAYIVYSGGANGGGATPTLSNAVYVATFGADGTVGSWTQQTTNLPQAMWTHAMATYTSTSGQTYLYVIGGSTQQVPSTGLTSVYMNTLSGYGATGNLWTATSSLPTGLLKISASCTVLNGYVIVCGGGTSGIYYAKINDANGTLGPWLTGPPLFTTLTDISVCTWADQFIMLGGVNGSTAWQSQGVASMSSSGQWAREVRYDSFPANSTAANFSFTTPPSIAGSDFDMYSVCVAQTVGSDAHWVGNVVYNLVSVPLKITGLTAGTNYWIVFGCSGGNALNYTQTIYGNNLAAGMAPTASTFAAMGGAHSPWPGGTWTADGNGTPVEVFGTSNGSRIVHVVEDNGAKLDWVMTDATTRLSGYAEGLVRSGAPAVASMLACTYDVNGELTGTTALA